MRSLRRTITHKLGVGGPDNHPDKELAHLNVADYCSQLHGE